MCVASIDFDRARSFIADVPEGRWTAYKDVAEAGGNARGAQAVGDWLRREGEQVAGVYRVLTVHGAVPDAFRPAGPGVPGDAAGVRELLTAEGVVIDVRGRAAQQQRFTVAANGAQRLQRAREGPWTAPFVSRPRQTVQRFLKALASAP